MNKVLLLVTTFFIVTVAQANTDIKVPNSPRAAFKEIVNLAKKKKTSESIHYFDFRHITNKERQKTIASKMNAILNQKYNYGFETISPLRLGTQDDGLPFYREKIATLSSKEQKFTIYLDRIRGANGSRWLISPLTIRNIETFHSKLTNRIYGDIQLPSFFFTPFFNIPLYYYLLTIVYGLACFLLLYILNPLKPIFNFIFTDGKKDERGKARLLNKYILSPVKLFVFTSCWYGSLTTFGIQENALGKIKILFISIVLFSVVWLLSRLVDFVADLLEMGSSRPILSKGKSTFFSGKLAAKALLYLVFILILLQNWGIDVTAIFASLGVGGIAIALAGQKTFENLFGGIMLATDKPVSVGDYCKFGDTEGVVEEIGPRSTKVRTLNRTLVVIPNGDFSQMQIENYHKRDKIRLKTVIGLTYSTPPGTVRNVLANIRQMLDEHPDIESTGSRVKFISLNAYSLDIEIFCLALTSEWSEFLGIKEDILLRLMDIVEESGSSFAFPTQTIEITKD